jgi:hypothetical protein
MGSRGEGQDIFPSCILKKKTCVALVRKQTIPTKQPPLIGELSANFCGLEGVTWSMQQIPTAKIIGFLDRSRYFSIK